MHATRHRISTLLALAATVAAAAATATTAKPVALHLSPAALPTTDASSAATEPRAASSLAAKASAPQLNQVLAYHLDVPGERLGHSHADVDIWRWATPRGGGSGKAIGSSLDDAKRRLLVLVDGIDEAEWDDLTPADLPRTHVVDNAPATASFEALLHSYGERLSDAIPAVGGYLGFLVDDVASGLSYWTQRLQQATAGEREQMVPTRSAILEDLKALAEEGETRLTRGVGAFLRWAESLEDGEGRRVTQAPSYETLRFDGLEEVRAKYGRDSEMWSRAKSVVQKSLAHAKKMLEATSAEHALAVILAPPTQHDDGDESGLSRRQFDEEADDPLEPFSTTLWNEASVQHQAFLEARPKPSAYAGKCFAKKSQLESATNDCSGGHGTAQKQRRGGRECWRCVCGQTKEKGSVTTWAGEACEKKDISGPFVLLATTVLGLVAITVGSVKLLISEGQRELPSVLAGISIPSK